MTKMHKKVLQEYKKYHAQLPDLSTAEEENHRVFYQKTKTSGKPIQREIVKVVRLKEKGKEYFYYGQELRSEDSLGNELEVYMQPIGKYEKPTFQFIVDPNTDAKIPNGIKSHQTVYELEWPKDWNPDLENDLSSNVDLLVSSQGRKYGGYTWEQFKNESFENLVMIGKYGTVNPSPKIIDTVEQRRAEKEKEKRNR
jgi:hypothetical protein